MPNQSKEEWKALRQLTADNGMALVVVDRQEYIKKAKILQKIPTHIGLSLQILPTNTKQSWSMS